MSQSYDTRDRQTKGMVLLAPAGYKPGPFRYRDILTCYNHFLAGAQRLRGEIYVRDGAVSPTDLTDDGRHPQLLDAKSWHLLIVDDKERVMGCIRICVHPRDVICTDLDALHCWTLRSEPLGPRIRRALQSHIARARLLDFSYVEVGGLAVSHEIRCTSEVIRMLLMIYAFGQLIGGAYGLSTVTTRHQSSSIVRRLGGESLVDRGEEIPPYNDPCYGCEMELLTFDSTKPNARYSGWIDDSNHVLANLVAIGPGSEETQVGSLLQLDRALSGKLGLSLGSPAMAFGDASVAGSKRDHSSDI
jgi:hypothetical protein